MASIFRQSQQPHQPTIRRFILQRWLRVPQPPFRRFNIIISLETLLPLPEALEGKRKKTVASIFRQAQQPHQPTIRRFILQRWFRVPQPPFRRFNIIISIETLLPLPEVLEGKRQKTTASIFR